MKKYWFSAKRYGFGWVPCSWQGWLILVGFVAAVIADFVWIDRRSHSVSDTLINVVPHTILLISILLVICWFTGEKPRWRWGKKE